jgi:transposase InsO family protein
MTPLELVLFGAACYRFGLVSSAVLIPRLGRIVGGPGHRATGERKGRTRGVGWEVLHVAIDDATRLVSAEILPDEQKGTTTRFALRALRWFGEQGVRVRRVLTDNGSPYRSKVFGAALRRLRIKHKRTRPYRPQANGKVERWMRTVLSECLGRAHARPGGWEADRCDMHRTVAYVPTHLSPIDHGAAQLAEPLELAFYGWKEGAAHRFFGPPNVPDVWPVKEVSPNKMVHLTEKPDELARRASSALNPHVPSASHDGRG